jgi:alpha-N-acetylglucosamine transferase
MGRRRSSALACRYKERVRVLLPFLILSTVAWNWNLQGQWLQSLSSTTLSTMGHAPPSRIKTNTTTTTTITTTETHTGSAHVDDVGPSRSDISIAYITTIAFCGDGRAIPERKYSYRDAPAVLAHSIRMAHRHSQYTNYTLYAIVHPQAYACSRDYLRHDYQILVQESPVLPHTIQTIHYQKFIKLGGCCGAREFLKLYAYTMTSHHIVVHFDADAILLQPMDELFHVMIHPNKNSNNHHNDDNNNHHYHQQQQQQEERHRWWQNSNISLMRPNSNSSFLRPGQPTIQAFMTRDYIQGNPHMPYDADRFAIQGGFFVVKPSRDVLLEMIDMIQRGNYTPEMGWEGSRIGNFYGAAQIQGFLAYYYSIVHPQDMIELNRCRYNTMIYDEPKLLSCPQCDNCQITPLAQIKSIHYTTCQKPWACKLPNFGRPPLLCQQAHHLWFLVRQDLERNRKHSQLQHPEHKGTTITSTTMATLVTLAAAATTTETDYTLGYCQNGTYQPMTLPAQ